MDKTPDTLNQEDDIAGLVRQAQAGDRSAFDSLVRRYLACAMKTAVKILANADDAAEAVQDGFVVAYLKIKKLKNPEKFGPWLLRIMANCAIDRQKAALKRKQLLKRVSNPASGASNPHEDVIRAEELQSALQSAMGQLTKMQAQAIALFGIEELSHKEAADILGCSPGAARGHLFGARKKLKVLLKDYKDYME